MRPVAPSASPASRRGAGARPFALPHVPPWGAGTAAGRRSGGSGRTAGRGAGAEVGPAPGRTVGRGPGCVLAADDRGEYDSGAPRAGDPTTVRGATSSPDEPAASAGRTGLDRLAEVVDQLGTLLGASASELEAHDNALLRERVALLRRVEGMASAAMATTVGVLSRSGGIAEDGASSTTAWVAQQTGRSRREATRTTRLSASLPELPGTAAALAAGELGPESADAIARAAQDGRLGTPQQVEETLLPVAAGGPERLQSHVRDLTQQADGAALLRDEQRQRARRRFSLVRGDDGMWEPHGKLTDEVGARFRTLLDAVDERDPAETPVGQRRRPDQRLADALERVVDMALDLGPLPTVGGITRPHVSVLVDLATLDTDLTDPDEPDRPVRPDHEVWASLPGAETAWAGTLSPQTARRICCDAGISRVVMAGSSQVLDVGRETRPWSTAQRRAVNARDRSCRGPGCGRPIGWTQIHHLQWWRHGGETNLDNGIALCSACHDLVHHRGWHAELDVATAAVTWTSPDRRRTVVTHPRPPA